MSRQAPRWWKPHNIPLRTETGRAILEAFRGPPLALQVDYAKIEYHLIKQMGFRTMKKDDIVKAPMFSVFGGAAVIVERERFVLLPDEWYLNVIDGGVVADAHVRLEACKRGIELAHSENGEVLVPLPSALEDMEEAEYASRCKDGRGDFLDKADFLDAALAYIMEGGVVAKLPDTMKEEPEEAGNIHWCLYAVARAHAIPTRATEPAPAPIFDET